jgi:hypothetical protein
MVHCGRNMSLTKIGEWFWRFLAAVMLFAVCWTVWIIYQLNPAPLVTNAAFVAAAKAKTNTANSQKQQASGLIAASTSAEAPKPPAPAAAPTAPEAPKTPPINPEKLKYSESIAIPAAPAKK